MNKTRCMAMIATLVGIHPLITGLIDFRQTLVASAIESSQQLNQINLQAQSSESVAVEQAQEDFFGRQRAEFLEELRQAHKNLPSEVLGMTEAEFKQADGKLGYVQTGLWLNLEAIFPVPKVGMVANRKDSLLLIFNRMELIDRSGSVMLTDALPVDQGYKITAYRLRTGFMDASDQFYQLYYEVKYQEPKP